MMESSAKKLTVAVLMGGASSEHEISLKTGQEVLKHLDKEKYNAVPVILAKDEILFWQKIKMPSPDVAFIALHGKGGEDGAVQGLLELAGIPYTGSGILASALGLDKVRSMDLFQFHGLAVPEYISFSAVEFEKKADTIAHAVSDSMGFPCVVKPNDGGSSVGVTIARDAKQLLEGIAASFELSPVTIVQKFINGQEATCGVLDLPAGRQELSEGIQALPPVHIVPRAGEFFDFESKYAESGSDEICPADFASETNAELQQIALKVHTMLGCAGYSRTDMMIRDDGEIFVLETNTLPGLTEASLLPKEAKATGISFSQLLDIIIQNALQRR